jgi:hypothetical protein
LSVGQLLVARIRGNDGFEELGKRDCGLTVSSRAVPGQLPVRTKTGKVTKQFFRITRPKPGVVRRLFRKVVRELELHV